MFSFRHGTNHNALSNLREIARKVHRATYTVEQTQKVIPLTSRETSFGQNVCELVFGVNIFDLDLGFQIDSLTAFDDHLGHSLVDCKHVQLRLTLRRMCWYVRNPPRSPDQPFVLF